MTTVHVCSPNTFLIYLYQCESIHFTFRVHAPVQKNAPMSNSIPPCVSLLSCTGPVAITLAIAERSFGIGRASSGETLESSGSLVALKMFAICSALVRCGGVKRQSLMTLNAKASHPGRDRKHQTRVPKPIKDMWAYQWLVDDWRCTEQCPFRVRWVPQ